MRTKILLHSCILAFLCSCIPAMAAPPKVQQHKDGIGFWLMEDHTLPIVTMKIVFRHAGSAYDMPEKSGLAEMVTYVLDDGTDDLTELEFQQELEENAIKLSLSVDKDYLYIDFRTLSENRHKAMELLGKMLSSPRLDEQSVTRAKNQLATRIRQKMEEPQYLSSLKWNEVYFGEHPYAMPTIGHAETVQDISREDILRFIKDKLTRDNMVISVVGDINAEELSALLARNLSALPEKSTAAVTKIEDFTPAPASKTENIARDIPQAVATFGFAGARYNDKDFYPTYIMNYILGGGSFESRLMEEVREKRGLAYSVYSAAIPYDYAGLIKGAVGTRHDQIDESLKIIKQQIEDMQVGGARAEEVAKAKNYLTGSFPLRLDSTSKLVNYLSVMQLYNLGSDFLEKRNDYIRNVTVEDVNAAASKFLDVEKLVVVVVGK